MCMYIHSRHHPNMKLVLYLLVPIVYGLTSSLLHDFQITSLKPKWISLTNEDGSLNVTVDYDHYGTLINEVQCYWWVNGKLITDGDYNIRVNNFNNWRNFMMRGVYEHSDNPIDEHVRRATILLPPDFEVQSIQLQLVSDVFDKVIDINVVPLASRKSTREYIPEYKLEMNPKDEIVYDRGDSLNFIIHFTAENVDKSMFDEIKAEFIGMEPCITPSLLNVKSSDRHGDFLPLRAVNHDQDWRALPWDVLIYVDNPSHKIRLLNVFYGSTDVLPRGLIKVTAGYRSRSPCRIFAGAKVTRFAFLKPPPHAHEHFFPDDAVAFVERRSNYYVEYGGSIDISVTAVGGSLKPSEYWRHDLTANHPEVYLIRKRKNVTALADVKRLFQREAVFRFQNVTNLHSGRYVAIAKVENGRAKANFNIFVQKAPSMCRL